MCIFISYCNSNHSTVKSNWIYLIDISQYKCIILYNSCNLFLDMYVLRSSHVNASPFRKMIRFLCVHILELYWFFMFSSNM